MQTAFVTHTGGRHVNQDNGVCDQRCQVFAVADGVGGGLEGEHAAAVVCLALQRAIASGQSLSQGALNAHQSLRQWSGPGVGFRASTLAALLLNQRYAELAWVGDSRIYLLREGELIQLSSDHNQPEAEHVLTQAIGAPLNGPLQVDSLRWERRSEDCWLLCTDGVHRTLQPQVLHQHLSQPERSLLQRAEALKQAVLAASPSDNFTFVLLQDDTATDTGSHTAPNTLPEPTAGRGSQSVSTWQKALGLAALFGVAVLLWFWWGGL